MNTAFLQILNMSLTASYVILFVLAARLFLKKASKIFSYALWSVVLFRLVCPFSFEGLFSFLLVNSNPIPTDIVYAKIPQINTGIAMIDNAANPVLATQTATQNMAVNPMQIWVSIGNWIWLAGITVLLVYSIASLLRLRLSLVGAVKWRDNIFLADHIASPFVMGVIHPKIYLPSNLSAREQEYIILHEQTHIRRYDHIIKTVAFLALIVHWFNPLIWMAFFLCSKDMEMSCDESVLKHMAADIRVEYSASLLSLAAGRKRIAGIPLAFGEGDTKSRIKNVLNYKKPALWLTIVALSVCVVMLVGFTANPKTLIDISDTMLNAALAEAEKVEEIGGIEINELISKDTAYLSQITDSNVREVVFPVSGYNYYVSVSFTRANENSEWILLPANAVNVYDPGRQAKPTDTDISRPPEPGTIGTNEMSVSVDRASDELLNKYASFDEFIEFEDEEHQKIIIAPSVAVRDFRFIEVGWESEADEIHFVESKVLYSTDELTPEKPFVVTWMEWGLMPHRGISFVDETNTTRYFYIAMSGENGSLFLVEFK